MALRHRLVLVAVLSMLGGAGAERVSWHGPWRGLDLHVTVITRGHAVDRPAGEWWQWGNTSTDAYLFGFGRPGVDLVLDFTTHEGKPRAVMYVIDPARRGSVEVRPDSYLLPPGTLPRMSVRPLEGGWWVGDRPNFNVQGMYREALNYADTIKDISFNYRVGSHVPGEPAWTTSVVSQPVDPNVAYPLFGAAVRADPGVPYELAPPLLPSFPYLSAREYYDFYGPNQPAMFEISSRRLINRFVGFQTAGIYAFNSYSLPPTVAFEAPFAWYRFDDRIGRFPNLVVRVEQFPKWYTLAALPQVQRTAVRLSWTGRDFRSWRYSLSVAGEHALKERVLVGQTPVSAISYARLPSWTTSRPWRAVSFVEATKGLAGSEGIYSYSVEANPALFPWLAGLADAPPDTFRAPYLAGLSIVDPYQLPEGYRGEYNLAYNRAPRLYRSGIDRRVHLEYADGGVWNLGEGYLLRTHNVTGGPRINTWLLERVLPAERASRTPRAYKNEAVQSLFALGGYLLYSDARGAVIRRANLPPDVPLPTPDNRARWQTFLQNTEKDQPERDPRDLRGWLRAFEGPTLNVPGGALNSLRVTPDGFRFVLRVPKGTVPKSSEAVPVFPRLGAGRHVLTYTIGTGRWTAKPATPAAVRGSVEVFRAREFEPGELTVSLLNSGTLDQSGRAVLLADGVAVKEWATLTVPGQSRVTRRLTWSPRHAGTTRFAIRWQQGFVNAPQGPENSEERPSPRWQGPAVALGGVQVQDTPRVQGRSAISLSTPQSSPLGLTLLLCLLALGGYSLWRVWEQLE